MTVLDAPFDHFVSHRGIYKQVLEAETCFGVGRTWAKLRSHAVMDENWHFSPVTAGLKDKAHQQLGTSGSGNHFAEFGRLTVIDEGVGIPEGEYLALLTHSGSRGAGAAVADHFSALARRLHPELPRNLGHLAWLSMDSHEGREYWQAMQLMARYAAANHEIIHRQVLSRLGERSRLTLENHHNLAEETQLGLRKIVLHRKGATPADRGRIGIIPGSMASPAYVVKGLGHPDALDSAAHGAGRRMSRNAARKRFNRKDLDLVLKKKQVTLISAGLDEVPMAYKDIETVMDQQHELVTIMARFEPKLVKMAPPGRPRKRRKK